MRSPLELEVVEYGGPPVRRFTLRDGAVPRQGEQVEVDGDYYRVLAVVWHLTTSSHADVQLVVVKGGLPV